MTDDSIHQPDRKSEIIHRLASKPGKRGKIDAKCCECIYGPAQVGTWRLQVEKCTSRACPLYSVRPTSEYREQADG